MRRLFQVQLWLLLFLMASNAFAQKVTYTDPERDDYKTTEFEIIGKVGGNLLVYKANKGEYYMSVYDNDMRLVDRVPLELPKKLVSVDFIAYHDKAYMVYQFQFKDVVYSYYATFNGNGAFENKPEMIDSTRIGYSTKYNNVYSVEVSEDKSKILIYKINQDDERNNIFYTFLYNSDFRLINNSRISLQMESKRHFLNNFNLSNDGDLVFTKLERSSNKDYITQGALYLKRPAVDTFSLVPLEFHNRLLDDIRIKLNNATRQATILGFFYKQKRGNVEGLYITKIDYSKLTQQYERFMVFSDDLKANAKGDASTKTAFNDFFIRKIINTQDGGFLVTAESYYTTNRYQPWNRWDYMYGGYGGFYPYYYSPYNSMYYNPYYWNDSQGNRYHYDNIAILSIDGEGKPVWSNIIRKSQFDDNADLYLSFMIVNVGSELRFLFNDIQRRNFIVTDNSISPDGKLNRLPLLRNQDKGFTWMPRYGKQIGARTVVIPVVYRNYICFAKIDF